MSRILFATLGSLGDLHPAIALALELRRRGHQVGLGTSEFYRDKITALGLGFHPLPPAISLVDEAFVRQIMNGRRGTTWLLRDLMLPATRALHAALAPVAAGADLLVASELVYPAPILGEQTGLPWVSYALAPVSLPSVHDPSLLPGPPGTHWVQSLGPAANRLLLLAARARTHGWWAPVRRLRRELGLPPGANPVFDGKYSPRLNLALFSPVLQPPQPDWPAATVQTGFPFYDESAANSTPALPATVEAFLAAGPPPVVFTLGSAAVHIADDFYVQAGRAAHLLGRRALLLLGRNPPPPGLPPSVFAWDYLPYALIFPRAAAIVHQGGVGTTAQALRAGRPQLVVPFAHDQPDNAARVTRLGVGRVLPRPRFREERVARELAALFADPAVAALAADLGLRVQAERGVAAACDALEGALRVS